MNGLQGWLWNRFLQKLKEVVLALGWLVALGLGVLLAVQKKETPQWVLLEVAPLGTRVIQPASPESLENEAHGFVSRFLKQAYEYDSSAYEKQMESLGDHLSETLWKEKSTAFQEWAQKIQDQTFQTRLLIRDLRVLEPLSYQADLGLEIRKGEHQKVEEFQVEVKLGRRERTKDRLEPYKVVEWEEKKVGR